MFQCSVYFQTCGNIAFDGMECVQKCAQLKIDELGLFMIKSNVVVCVSKQFSDY